MPTTAELLQWLDAAREAARRGAAVLEEWRPRFQVREKARFDLVTDADLGSQAAVYEHLRQRFPGHAFLGEEDVGPRSRPGADSKRSYRIRRTCRSSGSSPCRDREGRTRC